jgi:chemotaxis protein methyltransferase CheR
MEEIHLKRIKSLIASQIGLLIREQDVELLRKVVAERLRALNLSSAEQYCQLLGSEAGIRHEREELAVLLSAGETYFFRDSGQHVLLQDRILPELLERRKTQRSLRIWSAACASGEEAYSLAILLDELISDQSQWDIRILGTDINRHAIEKARHGIYTEWSFRGMSDERRQRYFHRHKDAWVLDDSIRSRVTFQTGDLVADKFPDYAVKLYDMDLILCRNTFIYMPPKAISHIADKFAETLAVGGILITGHGELYAHHLGQLRTRVFPESIVYQKVVAPFISPIPEPLAEVPRPAPAKFTAALPPIQKIQAAAPAPSPQQTAAEAGKKKAASEMQQAWQYANQGKRELSAKSCGEMIASNPLNAEPYYLTALLAQERGDFAETKDLLKKVIYLDPSFIAAYLDLGDLYAREGDGARAGKMRSTARDLLKMLSGDEQIKLYGASTVNQVLQYVDHLLNMKNQ